MVAVAGVLWKVATSLHNLQQDSALSMEVARNVLLLGAKRYRAVVLDSVLL
jgi:hypothetical protein